MRFVDEFRDGPRARALAGEINRLATRRWVVMEVCGGQTHALLRFGVDALLSSAVELVHGPGCPVCVTSLEMIDLAQAIARTPGVLFTSFGDMLRIPGTQGSLLGARARGADVRFVYSPLDALRLAKEHPSREVVFFAAGFETTSPMTAMALFCARAEKVANFSVLCAHLRMPPVMAALLQSPDNRVQAYLGPGHVAAIMGLGEYEALCARYRIPVVISGFEPVDLLEAVLQAVRQLESGRASVENPYARAVRPSGNVEAQALLDEVFEVCDRSWRGIGSIPKSGFRISSAFREHDAEARFDPAPTSGREPDGCISGQVLKGVKRPSECPSFGRGCTPERPLGATMVSSEGACAAYFAYRRQEG